jgi:hypothetical protein
MEDDAVNYDDDTLRPDEPLVLTVPAWWCEVWERHQLELRALIRDILRFSPKIAYTPGSFELSCSRYDRREVDAALDDLVADGVIERVDGRYRLPGGGG